MLAVAVALALSASPVPLRLTADVDDAYATLVNPGGLGVARGAELRLLFARARLGERSDLAVSGSARLGPLGIGAGLAWDDVGAGARFVPYLGLGLGGESFGVGASWQRVSAEDGRFAAGAIWRPARELSLGFACLDLGALEGPRPFDLGVALRLFHERALLSARWRLLQGQPLEHDGGRPDVRFLLSAEPIAGVTLAAGADLHFRPSVQLTLDLEHVGIGGGVARIDDDGPAAFYAELAAYGRPSPTVFIPSRVAVLELSGDLTPEGRFDPFAGGFEEPIYGAAPLLLDAMAHDPDLEGALFKIGALSLGWGRLEELRRGIAGVRASGRRVDCVLSAAEEAELYVASACDRVAVLAALPVTLDGLAASFVFLGEGLEELGVHPQVARRGDFKNAPDLFTERAMSDAEREVADALLDQAWGTLESGLAEGRRVPPDELARLVSRGTFTATEARDAKLVDDVLYPDELEGWVRGHYEGSVAFIDAPELPRPDRRRWSERPKIALITIDAAITPGESSDLPFGLGVESGADTVVRALEAARQDGSVRAIVLRVDSPGGDAVASELIARAVEKTNAVKPVIASLGDVAASGGYYVAAPARRIYASPGTITGSIGIFSLGFSLERLLARLGIHGEALARGEAAARGGLLRDETPAERAVVEREIEGLYRQFLGVVARGRAKPVAAIRDLAEGRVWTGAQARERGLVDELGGLTDAIARARLEGGLADADLVELAVLPSRRDTLPDAARRAIVGEDPLAGLARRLPASLLRVARAALGVGTGRGVAALPYVVDVR